MAWKIIWSDRSIITYNATLDYLRKEWTEREVNNFASRVNEKLQIIERQPRIGNEQNKRKRIYRTLVHKKVTLVYRLRPMKEQIELVTFWNNQQNPNHLKYGN